MIYRRVTIEKRRKITSRTNTTTSQNPVIQSSERRLGILPMVSIVVVEVPSIQTMPVELLLGEEMLKSSSTVKQN